MSKIDDTLAFLQATDLPIGSDEFARQLLLATGVRTQRGAAGAISGDERKTVRQFVNRALKQTDETGRRISIANRGALQLFADTNLRNLDPTDTELIEQLATSRSSEELTSLFGASTAEGADDFLEVVRGRQQEISRTSLPSILNAGSLFEQTTRNVGTGQPPTTTNPRTVNAFSDQARAGLTVSRRATDELQGAKKLFESVFDPVRANR